MKNEKIQLTFTLIGTIGTIATLLNYMFPKLFPTIGLFLVSLEPSTWIITLTVINIAVQLLFFLK